MTFSEKLLNFRAEHKLTQKQMAEILEVNPQMVYKYENDLSKPSKKNHLRFNKILDSYN